MKARKDCHCACHKDPNVKHVMQCCIDTDRIEAPTGFPYRPWTQGEKDELARVMQVIVDREARENGGILNMKIDDCRLEVILRCLSQHHEDAAAKGPQGFPKVEGVETEDAYTSWHRLTAKALRVVYALLQSADDVAGKLNANPVAWTVVGPDGETSIGGWHGMGSFEVIKTMAVLRKGHRYAFAYSMESVSPEEANKTDDVEIEALIPQLYGDLCDLPLAFSEKWAAIIRKMAVRKEKEEPAPERNEGWHPCKEGEPMKSGTYLCTVATDEGLEVHTLKFNTARGYWMHEGEATFCHGYYFEPVAWKDRPEPYPYVASEED